MILYLNYMFHAAAFYFIGRKIFQKEMKKKKIWIPFDLVNRWQIGRPMFVARCRHYSIGETISGDIRETCRPQRLIACLRTASLSAQCDAHVPILILCQQSEKKHWCVFWTFSWIFRFSFMNLSCLHIKSKISLNLVMVMHLFIGEMFA